MAMTDPHQLNPDLKDWVYLRVYLGEAIDRMDWFLTRLHPVLSDRADIRRWFFIRYMDEGGIHVRLRALAHPGQAEPLRVSLVDAVGALLSRINAQPPGDYVPMVTMPGMGEQMQAIGVAHNDLRIVETEYQPEYDKFGGPAGMAIAEALFHASSGIACEILASEAEGAMSRKGLLPALMLACHDAFRPDTAPQVFWREYAYYWLGSRTPAAEDWRDKFSAKAAELAESGISPLQPEPALRERHDRILSRWRAALDRAAGDYAALGAATDMNAEVVSFTIAHLMNNRLGIAPLEEAYLASLIEAALAPEARVA